MSNYAKLYWLTRLDSIVTVLIFLLIICVVGLIMYFVSKVDCYGDEEYDEFKKNYGGYKKTAIVLGCISVGLLVFLPSKDEVILIVAGGKAMDFVESDTSINKLPSQTTALITEYLDKQLKEIKSK